MEVKKFNITKPKEYTKKGELKKIWQNIGVMTEFHKDDGSVSRIIEIPAIGLEASLFPFKDSRDDSKAMTAEVEPADDEVTPDVEF